MTRLGCNGPNRALVSDDLERIRAANVTDVLLLHDYRDQVASYIAAGLAVHIRVNWRGAFRPAEQEASDLIAMIRQYPQVKTWRVWNEPQIEIPCTPAEWFDHNSAVWQRVRQSCPSASYYLAAPSPSINLASWISGAAGVVMATGMRSTDIHAYGNPDEVTGILNQYKATGVMDLGAPMITEYNFGAGRQYSLTQYAQDIPRVLALAQTYGAAILFLFIWEWSNPDMALPTTVNIKNTPIETALQEMNVESPPTFTLGFQAIYEANKNLIGLPLVNAWGSASGNVHQDTVRGELLWHKARNQNRFLGNDGGSWVWTGTALVPG